LEAYDRNYNFGQPQALTTHDVQLQLPDSSHYKDVNASSQVIRFSMPPSRCDEGCCKWHQLQHIISSRVGLPLGILKAK